MEESRESTTSTTEHEHKDDGSLHPLPLARKKPRYRSAADFVDLSEERRPKTRIKNQKVIYQPSPGQSLELAVAEVVDGEPGDIAYWLRYRNSEERYCDGSKGVFAGQDLHDDPSDPYGLA